jgi:hypothetical protein
MSDLPGRYLAELKASPGAAPRILAARAGLSRGQLDHFRRDRAFKDEETAIKVAHQAVVRERVTAETSTTAAAELLPPELDPDISPALQAWLTAYAKTDDRLDSVRLVRETGLEISWRDVQEALRSNKAFCARYSDLWAEGVIEAEDKGVRKKAREGGFQAAKLVVAAEMPEKYGDRLKVDHTHSGTIRVEHGHRHLIEEAKAPGGFLDRYRLPALAPPDDVVDAEVVHE